MRTYSDTLLDLSQLKSMSKSSCPPREPAAAGGGGCAARPAPAGAPEVPILLGGSSKTSASAGGGGAGFAACIAGCGAAAGVPLAAALRPGGEKASLTESVAPTSQLTRVTLATIFESYIGTCESSLVTSIQTLPVSPNFILKRK